MPRKLLGAAAEFLEGKFRGPLTERETTATIGTSAASVLSNDPESVLVLVVNLSANTVHVGFSASVSGTSGIRIGPLGGSVEIDVENDGMLPTREIFAISDDASTDLYMVRVRRFAASREPSEGA